jgi:hypothetical protein
LRHASAIDFSDPSDHMDGSDIKLEQLAELADTLLEQVGAVRGHYEQLQHTLDENLPEPEQTVGGASPVDDFYEDDGFEHYDSAGPQVHDSARLVVMEMAMSGSSRDETKDYLRQALSIDGGDQVVDEVFDRTEAAQEAAPLRRRLFTRRHD